MYLMGMLYDINTWRSEINTLYLLMIHNMPLNYKHNLYVFWVLIYKTLRSTRELTKYIEQKHFFSSRSHFPFVQKARLA